MTEIYVDADACPVRDEVFRVAERHGVAVHLVTNGTMRPPSYPLARIVLVGQGADAADDWIAEHIQQGDLCVTADIPLAARCLERKARALSPTGRPFTADNIGQALAMRELSRHLRETGAITGGPPPLGKADRSQFLNALETALQAIRRLGA